MGSLLTQIANPQPVQIANPLTIQQAQGALQAQQQQRQLAQQEQQLNAIKLQQAQADLDSQRALQQAYSESGGVITPDTFAKAAQYGASPQAIMNLQNLHVAQQQAAAKLQSDQLANHQVQTGIARDTLAPLLDMPEDEAAQKYPGVVGGLIKNGTISTQDMQAAGLSPVQYPGHDEMQHWVNGLNGYNQTLKNEQANRESAAKVAQEQAQAREANANAAVKELTQKSLQSYQANPQQALSLIDSIFPLDQPGNQGPNARYKNQLSFYLQRGDKENIDATVKAANAEAGMIQKETNPQVQANKVATAVAQARATAPIKIYQAGAEDAAKQQSQGVLTPNGESIAQAIANYQQMPMTSFSIRTPQGQAIMARVQQINPDYHSQYYGTFQKTENDATTGKIGTSANALNTMMGHLSVLNQAADALNNGNLQVLNHLANGIGAQTGNDAKTVYDTIVHRLGPEVTKAYLASGGSVGERGTNEEDFSSNLSPSQIKANIGVSAQLADSKIKALQDQYQRGTYGRGRQQLISPEAEQARQQLTMQSPVRQAMGGYKIGTRYGNLTYLGGDPNQRSSWK